MRADQQRRLAESFGADAERYDRARPAYPETLVRRILAASPGTDVLDVGCGTGIAARQFQAAGCDVVGVDVDARMVELARAAGLEAEVSGFETWDAAGRTFDLVIAGQAWHWIDPTAGAVKAADVLRPGGRLALFWNVFRPSPEVADAFAAVYRQVGPDLPFNPWNTAGLGGFARVLADATDGLREAGAFGDPQQWRTEWERPYTRAEWLDQVPTFGGHSQLPPATMEELATGLGEAVDGMGGRFTMGYTALVLTTERRARPASG